MSRLSLRLADLSPFGPIFGKELRTTARRKRNHALRVAYLGMLLLFLLLVYTSSSSSNVGGVAYRIQQQNELGQQFFAMFSMFCVIAMGLIGPVLTSTAINAERLAKTLPVLLMTPINSWQIVSGKLFSRLLISLMLIGLSLPVLAVVRLLGGVEVWQMLAVICICTAFALACAAIGLFYSTLLNRAYAVILLSYATILFLYLFAPMLGAMTFFRTANQFVIVRLLCTFNPVANVALLAIPNGPTSRIDWWPGVLVQLGLASSLLVASSLIVRRFERQRGERATVQAPAAAPPAPLVETNAEPISAPPPTPAAPLEASRPVGDNPILWRETRRPLMSARWRQLTGITFVLLLVSSYFCFNYVGVLDEREPQIGYACSFNGLFWLLVSVLSATAIAQEKESDTWTVLLVSPFGGAGVVLGKLIGIARRMFWPIILIGVHFTGFAAAGVISWSALMVVLWVTITFNTVWAACGVYLSLRFAKVTTAVIVTLLIPVALFIAVPLMWQVAGQLLVGHTADWATGTLWYLPYFYLGESIDSMRPHGNLDHAIYMPMLGRAIAVDRFLWIIFVAGIAHIVLAAAIVGHTIYHFDTIVGRAIQTRRGLNSHVR